jgi:hypothetical protein
MRGEQALHHHSILSCRLYPAFRLPCLQTSLFPAYSLPARSMLNRWSHNCEEGEEAKKREGVQIELRAYQDFGLGILSGHTCLSCDISAPCATSLVARDKKCSGVAGHCFLVLRCLTVKVKRYELFSRNRQTQCRCTSEILPSLGLSTYRCLFSCALA